MSSKPKIGVLLSGTGRTLENLFKEIEQGKLPIEISIVISSHPNVAGLEKAEKKNVPTRTVDFKQIPEPDFSNRITQLLREAGVQLVVMAGFIRHWKIPEEFQGKVLNIHPALLPEFGGKGMYGKKVHEAVWKAKKPETGCTVHYVDNQYDHGPIVLQRKVQITPQDTPETIARKVFEQECAAFPEAIRALLKKGL